MPALPQPLAKHPHEAGTGAACHVIVAQHTPFRPFFGATKPVSLHAVRPAQQLQNAVKYRLTLLHIQSLWFRQHP